MTLVRGQRHKAQQRKARSKRRARPLDLAGRLSRRFHLLVQRGYEILGLRIAGSKLMTQRIEMIVQGEGRREQESSKSSVLPELTSNPAVRSSMRALYLPERSRVLQSNPNISAPW